MLISVSKQVNHIIILIAWLCANNPGIRNPLEVWIRIYKNLGITNSNPNDLNTKSSALFEVVEKEGYIFF
ncbi:2186_t:CDS:2 [Gigaspora margarita]|uniref:2186_t:CDS:1 n=1 Tax=Gigaspora margarita TaxID=4874 RepID=A0ABM8VZM6_GIGMA|nr:2186_t:CDS:2 [Gigaspora margarita]